MLFGERPVRCRFCRFPRFHDRTVPVPAADGPQQTMVSLTCPRCGHVMFFDAARIRFVDAEDGTTTGGTGSG
ncbi:MAG TPA: hypothetical protein VFI47_07115 [Acidimicrobiales bacterium]|nr:hypothetical protein [Acidimicrobiales bacterium]